MLFSFEHAGQTHSGRWWEEEDDDEEEDEEEEDDDDGCSSLSSSQWSQLSMVASFSL